MQNYNLTATSKRCTSVNAYFTSSNGIWIYTWTKDGKKINTSSAR